MFDNKMVILLEMNVTLTLNDLVSQGHMLTFKKNLGQIYHFQLKVKRKSNKVFNSKIFTKFNYEGQWVNVFGCTCLRYI